MAIRVSLDHSTSYQYERHITVSPQVIRLRPAPHNRTPIHSYSLKISPENHFLNWQQDPHGNWLARLVFPDKIDHFKIEVNVVADLDAYNPFDFFLEPHAEEFPYSYSERELKELEPYLKTELTPELAEFLSKVDKTKRRTVDFLVDLNSQVYGAVSYVIRMEPGIQTPQETLTKKSGSCRDSSWLLVQACRQLGLAARFVSGYLVQLEPDEIPIEGPRGPTTDFTDLHAWCEVFVPGAGWIGLDPTSGLLTAEGHIPLAATPDPASAAPIEGMAEEAKTEFGFAMSVARVVNVPRITKPYTEEQWRAMLARGKVVDRTLVEQDLRLTMGGEPTFVGIDDPDAPEWNTAALGGQKFTLADRLVRRLQPMWASGAMFHHGQGKWYPGEQLPRWAISIVSRKDGEPIWYDHERFAKPDGYYGHSQSDAERFTRELIRVLGVDDRGLLPSYEDVWYYMWREKRLPGNVDPLKSNLDDPIERERLRRIFHQGLSNVVGWTVPLAHNGENFYTGHWYLRNEHCFLIPGDSPMGFRLPLDSIAWVPAADRDYDVQADPTVQLPELPNFRSWSESSPKAQIAHQSRYARQPLTLPSQRPSDGPQDLPRTPKGPAAAFPPTGNPQLNDFDLNVVRTALCAEAREGILRIFMPPIHYTEAYLELVHAIETTAANLDLKVMLEGYPPPNDPRLNVFKVTPDPGVIEVNVPPTSSFEELVKQTDELYAAAKLERLTAEKFEIDGKHVGSGGGNHITLGAETTLDSPFLRRPDMLRSLISFWHNHPSLSFLFAGQFIGPTSQAPRADEARQDSTYELEIAFKELDWHSNMPPWLVDRILRNLLVDVTGNTHRTEFCIDKLYSPDSSTGRLGLVEMRAFEMPPHHRMATAQHLLLRSVLAAFSKEPYREQLVKWGTSLHDRFMLPHFVRRDLADALSYLDDRGYPLDPDWFDPHYQFRFPYYGKVVRDDLSLEVRGALEPWHVMGEESAGGGQARYVDSSLERLQVRLRGATSSRHTIVCNGVEVPLHPTGTHGEYVAGIRYRAWQPPSCLHPTIGIHSPLHFDVYDRWNQRSIAGCTYHVVHPGGRAAESRPVNAAAAESRRIARFEAMGQTGGRYQPGRWGVNPDFPMTLDLRRVAD